MRKFRKKRTSRSRMRNRMRSFARRTSSRFRTGYTRARRSWRGKSRRQKAMTIFGMSMPMLAGILAAVWYFFIRKPNPQAAPRQR